MDWRETFKDQFGDTFRLCCDDKTLQGAVESFIENILEQERQRMSNEVEELPWLHNDSGVKELEENVDYVEVKEVMAIINK